MTDPAVDAWLAALEHPQKALIEALRALVLGADPRVREGIKWNVGSFRVEEWFATFHVRGPKGPRPVMLVLHRGARGKGGAPPPADPSGLLSWLGPDRATVTIADLDELGRKEEALRALVRGWVAE